MNQAPSPQAVSPPTGGADAPASGGDGRRDVSGSGLRAAHVRDTRQALLSAARELFAANGFQATRTEEVVQRAGLTRGALYHHFRDKEDLFRAVYDEVAGEVTLALWRRSEDRHTNAWDLFRANSEFYLDAASTNAAYRQIVLIDGPAVLGWNSVSERGDGPTQQIIGYLRDAVAEGVLEPQPLEPLAHLLAALGRGSALYVAHAADPVEARHEISACNDRFLPGLGVHGRADG
ncbi:MAG TPA: TetR/AcrR family transcriptional regulator [Acidimicrobiales bacterium]|jgi:AcrR family transcriptional regulator|nr:TetR/AcrR family transcriptional regulator [Acidimicrobiales bacterium]